MKKLVFTVFLIICSLQLFSQKTIKTENVFLITLDGLRWQELFTGADPALITNKKYVDDTTQLRSLFWHADALQRRKMLMPFFWSVLSEKGQLHGNRAYNNKVDVQNTYWFSYPGYNEILTGFPDKDVDSNKKINNKNVTVLEYLNNQKSLKGKVAAFGSWDVFPYIINRDRSGLYVNAGFEAVEGKNLTEKELFLNQLQKEIPSPWGSVRLDAFTHHFAMEYLKKNKPKVLFVAYGETDDFAHDGKYDAYLKSAYQTDQFIAQLWNWVQSTEGYKDKTTFIIATDHGRGTAPLDTWRSHGSEISGADQIWLAVIGPDAKAIGEVKKEGQLYQSQIAATVANALGYTFEAKSKPAEPIKIVGIKD